MYTLHVDEILQNILNFVCTNCNEHACNAVTLHNWQYKCSIEILSEQ